MKKLLFAPVFLCWITSWQIARAATPERPDSYYLSNGVSLEVVQGDPARAPYTTWQVWLYPRDIQQLRYGASVPYVRWGILQGPSAQTVTERLGSLQKFEGAYVALLGSGAWDRFTFLRSLGPVAVANATSAEEPSDLSAAIGLLSSRMGSLTAMLRPSLENAEPSDVTPLARAYFAHVRDCLVDVARFYDRMTRLAAEHSYLSQELLRLGTSVSQAEIAVPEVLAVLPSVKLPANSNWMSHTENQGSDGTLQVDVKQIGSTAWIRQSWTGGDGGMSGTVILTIVPFQGIGDLRVSASLNKTEHRWTVSIRPVGKNGFPYTLTSPERITVKHTYAPVDLESTEQFLLLNFSNPSDAQNAYEFLLYHKQRGQ